MKVHALHWVFVHITTHCNEESRALIIIIRYQLLPNALAARNHRAKIRIKIKWHVAKFYPDLITSVL
jgi:hypothetical protein